MNRLVLYESEELYVLFEVNGMGEDQSREAHRH
jgi:hypothetical protein